MIPPLVALSFLAAAVPQQEADTPSLGTPAS